MKEKEVKYLLIDSRYFLGNSLMFWASGSSGYTCDIRMAELYSYEDAIKTGFRDSDKLIKYVDALKLVQHHVDVQDVSRGANKKIWTAKSKFSHVYDHLLSEEENKQERCVSDGIVNVTT